MKQYDFELLSIAIPKPKLTVKDLEEQRQRFLTHANRYAHRWEDLPIQSLLLTAADCYKAVAENNIAAAQKAYDAVLAQCQTVMDAFERHGGEPDSFEAGELLSHCVHVVSRCAQVLAFVCAQLHTNLKDIRATLADIHFEVERLPECVEYDLAPQILNKLWQDTLQQKKAALDAIARGCDVAGEKLMEDLQIQINHIRDAIARVKALEWVD